MREADENEISSGIGDIRGLVDRIRSGNLEVFGRIFRFYTLNMRRFASASVPSDAAEDLVQEVFLDIWRRRETLTVPDEEFERYLFGALRKKILQYNRNSGVRTSIQRRELPNVAHHPGLTGRQPDPADARLLTVEFNSVFVAETRKLSEVQRAVLALRWGQGMSFSDIAATLQITENAAMLHASRIRKALWPVLQRYFRGLI